MIDVETLLRTPDPLIGGVFMLQKPVFVVEGDNVPRTGRCDNLTYSGEVVVLGTPYQAEAQSTGLDSPYSSYRLLPSGVKKYEYIIDCAPHFMVTYIETVMTKPDGTFGLIDIQKDPTPAMTWYGRSMFWLLKNIREWSYMPQEPFNSDHPMGLYSKSFFDVLSPAQEILDEIDSWPDMHLAKFLKGQDDYKTIPYPYPEPSQMMRDWLLSLTTTYPYKTLVERLDG